MPTKNFTLVIALALAGCTWETELPKGARSIPVVPDRELLVVDESVLAPLSANDVDGPLSYRHATEHLALDGDGATLRWLDAWSQRLDAEGLSERAQAFRERVTCRWLRSDPSNACDDSCRVCAAKVLPLETAPFRLIAVANRTDLSTMPDRAADGGEGRLVFALTDGEAALPMTVIFEYAQKGTALAWAERWHELGIVTQADFPRALAAVTEAFVGAGSLAQIRTADALTGPMILHQFGIDRGELVPVNVRNTPDFDHVPREALEHWVSEQAGAIADGTALVPQAWWAPSSSPSAQPPSWVEGLPEHESFVRASCGGCHAQSESGFQIDPRASGAARLSRFLSAPDQSFDELRRRQEWAQLTLWKR
jgi:hypothetical protein